MATKKRKAPAKRKTAAPKAAPKKKAATKKKSTKGTVVAASVVKREPGYLYYVDAAGSVRKTKMARGRK